MHGPTCIFWANLTPLSPQMSFLKASHTAETREASVRKQCYQDVCFPAGRLQVRALASNGSNIVTHHRACTHDCFELTDELAVYVHGHDCQTIVSLERPTF
jgi:hypothetical protein